MSSAHSPTFPSLDLRHNSFSNPSVILPTSQLIFQPFRCFTYVTGHSPTLLSLPLRHRLFTYVTRGAAHVWSDWSHLILDLKCQKLRISCSLFQHDVTRTQIRCAGLSSDFRYEQNIWRFYFIFQILVQKDNKEVSLNHKNLSLSSVNF